MALIFTDSCRTQDGCIVFFSFFHSLVCMFFLYSCVYVMITFHAAGNKSYVCMYCMSG